MAVLYPGCRAVFFTSGLSPMPRNPDLPCADCGQLMWRRSGITLPAGQAKCRPCRQRAAPKCQGCGGPVDSGSRRCWSCHLAMLEATNKNPRGTKGSRRLLVDGVEVIDPRHSRAWRRLRDQVVAEEPSCTLRLPCCTGLSETGDHIIPVVERPDLALERTNVRGACHACNRKRGPRGRQPALDC